jgi:hypothetical protein
VVGQLYLRRHGVEINNKNTVRSFVKFVVKRKKRKNDFNALILLSAKNSA